MRRSVSLVMLPVYTRFLTPADYGVVELLTMIIEIAAIIFGARVGQAIFRYYSTLESVKEKNSIISSALSLGVILNTAGSVAIFIFSEQISIFFFDTGEYQNLINLFTLTFLLMPLTEIPFAFIRAQQRPWTFFYFNIFKLVLQVSLNLYFLIYLELHVLGVVYSAVITAAVLALTLTIYTVYYTGFSPTLYYSKKLFNFSLPLKLATLGSFYLTFGDRYFISHFSGLDELGIYSLGYKFGFIFTILAWTPFERSWDSEKYEIYKAGNANEKYQSIFIYLNIIMVFIGLAIALFSRELLIIMSDPAFHEAYKIVPIIILAYIFQAWGQFCNFGVLLSQKTSHIAVSEFVASLVITIAYLVLIPMYGIYGAAWATVVGFLVRFIWVNHNANKFYDMQLPWLRIALLLAIGTILFLLSLTASDSILISIPVKIILMAAFVGIIFYLPIMTEKDKQRVKSKILDRLPFKRA